MHIVEHHTAPTTASWESPASDPIWRERSHATRLALLVAAADQFYSVGYHGASLSEIATTAGVTKGALYFHFFHKRGVAEAVIAELNATWTAVVTEVAEHGLGPLAAPLAEVDLVFTHLLEDPIVRGGTRLLRDPARSDVVGGRTADTRRRLGVRHLLKHPDCPRRP
jgi:AcrR family transcriptional regulator